VDSPSSKPLDSELVLEWPVPLSSLVRLSILVKLLSSLVELSVRVELGESIDPENIESTSLVTEMVFCTRTFVTGTGMGTFAMGTTATRTTGGCGAWRFVRRAVSLDVQLAKLCRLEVSV